LLRLQQSHKPRRTEKNGVIDEPITGDGAEPEPPVESGDRIPGQRVRGKAKKLSAFWSYNGSDKYVLFCQFAHSIKSSFIEFCLRKRQIRVYNHLSGNFGAISDVHMIHLTFVQKPGSGKLFFASSYGSAVRIAINFDKKWGQAPYANSVPEKVGSTVSWIPQIYNKVEKFLYTGWASYSEANLHF